MPIDTGATSDEFDPAWAIEAASNPLHYTFGRKGNSSDSPQARFMRDLVNGSLSRDLATYSSFHMPDSVSAEGLASPAWGGTIKFASVQDLLGTNRADYTNVYLHEMGHIMGLGHSPLAREIMTAGGGSRTTLGEFQPREAMALHMMYQHRLAGNRPPDKDGALATQSAAQPTVSVIKD